MSKRCYIYVDQKELNGDIERQYFENFTSKNIFVTSIFDRALIFKSLNQARMFMRLYKLNKQYKIGEIVNE